MSKVRTYRCKQASGVRLEDLLQVMQELGLEPKIHPQPVAIRSYYGDTKMVKMTWKPSGAGLHSSYLRTAGVTFQVDKDGFLSNVQFMGDTWGVYGRFKSLCRGIWELTCRAQGQVRVPVTRMDLAEFGTLAQKLGAKLVQLQGASARVAANQAMTLQVAEQPIRIEVPTHIEGKPTIVREIPPIIRVQVNDQGAIELVMPQRVWKANQPEIENLKRAAICVVELADKRLTADKEGQELAARLKVERGLITDLEIERRSPGAQVEIGAGSGLLQSERIGLPVDWLATEARRQHASVFVKGEQV